MKTLNHYRVGILKNGECYFEHEKVSIVIENDTWIVLNTDHFEKVTKSKTFDFCHPMLNKPKIWSRENESYFTNHKYWGNGVFYEIYTTSQKRPSTIKKSVGLFIDEKYGFLSSIDLSFIK